MDKLLRDHNQGTYWQSSIQAGRRVAWRGCIYSTGRKERCQVPVMNIDMVVPGLSLAAGGPTRTVVKLCDALASGVGAEVRLISQQKQSDAEVLLPREKAIETHIERSARSVSFELGLPGRKAVREAFAQRRPQILHSNGIWHPLNHWATSAARCHQIPFVIHPRGMLEPWALGWRATKKRLALAVY